ncbi:helix-turn-helix transcriptional regulator [Streptomyces kunmingensis]|uniref:Helix-turn-helix transcriptional regulator n=1 Tax=Streptomyces kunmingensis TaxID=68225 RepID=A0ABU6CFW2_9ACTN|nr:helix-turn-helix transcriptional regulator [Streptomyces kunmingensis]MEB3963334.1 helix-turn-helix transcriptional regulator [Streptomyces kunmingensis]
MTTATRKDSSEVGRLLRGWREQRRVSQLELALRADSSARHISFVETGRSRPSEELILKLAEHLDVPMRERNSLLLAAGYAPRFTQTPLDDPSMGALRDGLERLLRGYEPYPALIVDATYNVVATNRGLAALMAPLPEELLRQQPLNAMRLTLHPQGLAPRIKNLREWRGHLLAQMERQIALARSQELRELYEEVAAYPVPEEAGGSEPADPVPYFALPMVIEHDGHVLSFVSSISTFNTPMDVTVAELAIETLLPADPATVKYLRSEVG